jgi:hypothetical protein
MENTHAELHALWENREHIRVSSEAYDELKKRIDCFTGEELPTPHCSPDTYMDCPCDDMCASCTEIPA